MRNLVRLAVLLLIAHALYRFVPVYLHYYQFKDAVAETALFAKDRTDTELVDRVMMLAERYQIPIERDAVQVSRDTRMTYITLMYEEQIEWVPTYRRTMPFTVAVEGWHVRPSTGVDPLTRDQPWLPASAGRLRLARLRAGSHTSHCRSIRATSSLNRATYAASSRLSRLISTLARAPLAAASSSSTATTTSLAAFALPRRAIAGAVPSASLACRMVSSGVSAAFFIAA